MIRKFLICGKLLYLSTRRVEGPEKTPVCELLLPLEVFWELEKELKKADYLHATNEDAVVINDHYNKILRRVHAYTVLEKDRFWIADRLSGGKE